MTTHFVLALVGLFTLKLTAAPSPEYASLKADAEKFYTDGSFAKAHALYSRAMEMANITSNEARWVFFRNADTLWRSQAATQTADTTKLDQAREWLEQLLRETRREEDRDRTWVETQESLGDFHWTRRNQQNWGAAWPHYQQALDWWAGARDVETARERYLAIVWRMAKPPGVERFYNYGQWGNFVPLDVLDNTLKIAKSGNDQAHAHYLIAMTVRNQGGDWERRARVPEEFEGAIKIGKSTDWYDDALYQYAEWMAGQGRAVPLADGNWRQEPDYVKALELFRRLVSEFNKGETRYWEQAQQQIKNITEPQLGVSVPNIFLPDSEIQYHLNWRNLKQIELALYPVELNRDVNLSRLDEKRRHDWLTSIDPGSLEKVKAWKYEPARGTPGRNGSATNEHSKTSQPTATGGSAAARSAARQFEEDYQPGSEALRLDEKLKPGAYVLEARGGGKDARELILVTDAAVVLKTSGRQALVYFCNALSSAPLANAKVKLWERWHDGKQWQAREQSKETSADGVAVFDLENRPDRGLELFASAILKDRQAFSPGNSYWNRTDRESWRIYAFTDRPAYRPKETVNWKFIARRYNGSVYSTPNDATVEFEITDPHGAKVKADKTKLNAFGSAWGTLELTEQMPLGEYRVQFWDEGRKHGIGDAILFRLEEYKLPEFKVSVQTPEEESRAGVSPAQPRKKAFRVGEKVEVTIQADYYFGGPVANASVEVIVNQNPYWQSWRRTRDFPWFYEDMDNAQGRWGRHYGGGQIIKRETLKTDAMGKATLTFDTPANAGQDYEYRIEARVTDASRREITGSGNVRVTRQRYYVYPQAEHNLYRPQDKVRVDFKALDANEQPAQVEGKVTVTRDYWWEVWIKPDGTEVKGDELKALQAKHKIWPPAQERPDQKGWRLKFRGYQHDDVLTQTVKTDAEGNASLTFTPEREGYYRFAWLSEDSSRNTQHATRIPPQPIRAETPVWVCSSKTAELGYRHGGVEIIADKDTFRAGSEAPVMLVANSPDRYVLFTVEGEDLYHYRLVHMTGTVKLVDLFVDEKYVPNVFLSAAMVSDRQMFTDTKQVVVPPTKYFLTVDVKPNRAQYQPRDEGALTITTKNDEGKPVSAEVSLGLVDESVFYIQSDYAGDPRQFFFGTKRGQQIQTQSTMNQKSYVKLVQDEEMHVMDEREWRQRRERVMRGVSELDDKDLAGDALSLDGAKRFDRSSGQRLNSFFAYGVGGSAAKGAVMELGRAMNVPAAAGVPMSEALGAPDEAAIPAVMRPDQEATVQVRTDFRSTVFWQPDLKTDANGQATVKVKYPDSLTCWKATARAVSQANQFGIADATTRTKQPLIVRLQAPRFFVVGDTVTISAAINNNTDEPLSVKTAIEARGLEQVSVNARDQDELSSWIPQPKVAANSESRVDWTFKVAKPGEVKLKVTGHSGKYADAMEQTFTAHEHGIEKFISKSGKARGNDITVKLDLPKERKADSTSLTVRITPSLAVTMLDALPYLIDYPYGCTEQTMSRFLPAAITAKTLRDLGLQPEDVMGRVFGGIETNSAAATHPKGKQDLAELDAITKAGLERLYDFQHADGGWGWWKQGDSDHWMTAYVVCGLTLAKEAGVNIKDDTLKRGLSFLDKTLVEEEENPDMQAFMLHALAANHPKAVKGTGIAPSKFQTKAFDNLWQKREALNAYTRALLALSAHYFHYADRARTLIENLENGVKRDERPDQSLLVDGKNIQQPTSNAQPPVMGTAHWGEDGIYWRWSDGGVEATAFALRALLAIDPTNKLIEPVTNWLIKNRRGAQWSNTRDTAIVVLAMNDYLRVSGELKTELEYELIVNGKSIAKEKVSGADVFNAPSRFTIDPKLVKDASEIRIKVKSGKPTPNPSQEGNAAGGRNAKLPSSGGVGGGSAASVYFSVEAKFFSLEEPIAAAGNEIFVKREYFKLVGRPTLLKGYVYDKEPLRDGESVKSGERVETLITIEAKNNYEYLVFEDLKPAGFEAVEIRSSESLFARELKSGAVERKFAIPASSVQRPPSPNTQHATRNTSPSAARRAAIRPSPGPKPVADDSDFTGRTRWVYQELRDRKVALFIDKLPEGVWELRYDARAEVPGTFHALPVLGQAMYVPEIRCNGAELRVVVTDTIR